VLRRQGVEVVFAKGQLIQIYQSDLDYTFKTERKLLPKWSRPYRISEKLKNSYRLENLDGKAIAGEYSTRRLCTFTVREGTQLHSEQQEFVKRMKEMEMENEGSKEQMGKETEEEDGGRDRAWDMKAQNGMTEVQPGSEETRAGVEGEEQPDIEDEPQPSIEEETLVDDEDVVIFEGGTWSRGARGTGDEDTATSA
ncbi:hypothetical protein M404DRAFT_964967, partial [Pisolithus tinctorius Marx 270]